MKTVLSMLLTALFFSLYFVACSPVAIETEDSGNNPNTNPPPQNPQAITTKDTFPNSAVTLNAFSLGSDFPPDIQVPDIDGMRETAFVVIDGGSAKGVVPLDLTTFAFSTIFKGLDLEDAGITGAINSRKVEILSPTRALYLSIGKLVYFNPMTGEVLETVPMNAPVTLPQTIFYSRSGDCDGDGTAESSVGPGPFIPKGTEDIAVIGNLVFVSFNNGCFLADFSSLYIQGMVVVFDLNPTPPYLTPHASPLRIFDQFNSTGLTVHDGKLIVTFTGDTDLVFDPVTFTATTVPFTDSFLVEINPNTLATTRSLNLGLVAAGFTPLAVTADGSRGYIASTAFSEVYEIDLDNFAATRGKNNPIEIFDTPNDFLTDQRLAFGEQILFVSSSDNDGVKAVDLTDPGLPVLPTVLDFLIPPTPASFTGAGPMAVRPGQPTVDYTGPDLLVLTSSPGTVSTARTY